MGVFNPLILDAADIKEKDRVLDIGCGAGQLTRAAAERAAHGEVTGIDINRRLVDLARAGAAQPHLTHVKFVVGDAQVHALPEAGYDVAISRLGVMFFADPGKAFTNVARSSRPGGRVVFLTPGPLDDSELGEALDAAGGRARPDEEVSSAENIGMSLSSPDRVHKVLEGAGFTEVNARPVSVVQTWGEEVEDAAAFLADWCPIRLHLASQGPEADRRARAALPAVLRRYQGSAGVRLQSTGMLVTARRGTSRHLGAERPRDGHSPTRGRRRRMG
ncbi:class I SAM-dependent methyltransferase [Streptomyces sp. NPDC053069]|uniref:class I SAM-dependent methyltransferase n=1 Tax=Streptomyces sp. NPDC053069 TaxID=3365695 RepID=UPI0037D3F8E4